MPEAESAAAADGVGAAASAACGAYLPDQRLCGCSWSHISTQVKLSTVPCRARRYTKKSQHGGTPMGTLVGHVAPGAGFLIGLFLIAASVG